MAKKSKAPVHPETLRWARESAGYSLEAVAEKFLSKANRGNPAKTDHWITRLKEWETSGDDETPSIPQAQKLADTYRRPLSVLYLHDIPEELRDPELPDFRAYKEPRPLSPNLRFLIRETQQKQRWIRSHLELEQVKPPGTLDYLNPSQANPEDTAASILDWLEIDHKHILELRRESNLTPERTALNYWIQQAEKKGMFVMHSHAHKAYQVSSNEMSGFILYDDVAPVAVLNARDSETRRIFTLVHELVHWSMRKPELVLVDFRSMVSGKTDPVENFCDQAAASTLMPHGLFSEMWERGKQQGMNDEDIVIHLGRQLKISASAIAVRAKTMGYIGSDTCYHLLDKAREIYREQQRRILEKQKNKQSSGPPASSQAIKRAGKQFSTLILEAYEQGSISALDVSQLFGAKLKHFGKIAERLEFPLNRWALYRETG